MPINVNPGNLPPAIPRGQGDFVNRIDRVVLLAEREADNPFYPSPVEHFKRSLKFNLPGQLTLYEE